MRRQLKPPTTRPRDFAAFWQKTCDALADVAPEVQRQPRPDLEAPHRDVENLSFRSLGGTWVRGYLIQWRDDEPRPLVVHSHGYGSECAIQRAWSDAGVNVLGVDIRGFGRSFEALPLQSKWGYILTGIETPETSVLRGAVADYMRAVQIGRSIVGGRTSRTILHGASYSGGLALMAESLLDIADLLVVAVPTFGWAEGRNFFVKSGSGLEIARYLEARPESAEDTMLVFRYFDPINFANDVTCPTLVGVGLDDDVVPAKTVYAIANHLGGPHEIMEYPVSHTSSPEEALWEKFVAHWLGLAVGGLPAHFGEG